jgi:pyruvate/2-oxoglutarate dehydrogenase complex dihydrolipoamide dehydrogenase (E3) component
MRGHRVTLLERGTVLGGRLRIAAMPPHKEIFHEVIRHRVRQLEALGVRILLNTQATLSELRSMTPDSVIIATGTRPLIPDLPGVGEAFVMTYDKALAEPVVQAERIAVIGGGSVGCEVADFLSNKGKKIWLLEMLPRIALDMEWNNRVFLLKRLSEKGVETLTSAKVTEIRKGEVLYVHEDEPKALKGLEAVVLAVGMIPDDSLYQECLEESSWQTVLLGDARKPRKALEAVREGAEAGLAV